MALSVHIEKDFGAFSLRVDFDAENGPLALLGASGCGKSVTLKCIGGLMKPDRGTVVLDGVTLFDSTAKINLPPQKRRVGYLFQSYALFPNMTVAQNIGAAVADRQARKTVVAEQLRRFRLEEAAELYPHQLSGGQQQRTALSRILASDPQAILLDEPLSALDSFLKQQLEGELAEMLERFHKTVVWVSHDRREVYRTCRSVCVLDRGRSQPVRSMEDLFHDPQTRSAARLTGCENILDAEVRGTDVYLPQWGVTLHCGQLVPSDTAAVGIRAGAVRLAAEESVNTLPCRVVRRVADLHTDTAALSIREGSPLLRMEAARGTLPPVEHWQVAVSPEDILLLK